MRVLLFVPFITSLVLCWVTLDDPRVTLDQGTVRGKTLRSRSGKTFFSFQGIPYAAPPVGDLRFKEPQEPSSWLWELNAKYEKSACLQMHLVLNTYIGDEDCLYLNVYTPQVERKDAGLCVMVWIHGGGFLFGSGGTEMYGPHYLLDYDIILVTFNYRLGALGFLNLDTPEAPGNYGLKDQVAALRWVKKNVAKFGGNPECITIFGESAGGASVHYHMVSPMSRQAGLFHRAIVQSGTAYNPWAMTYNATKQGHLELAKELGCSQINKTELVMCLRSVEARHFPKFSFKMVFSTLRNSSSDRSLFAPTIESADSTEAFLTEDPRSILARGDVSDVPVMAGYLTHEGMIYLFGLKNVSAQQDYNEHQERFLPLDFGLNNNTSEARSVFQHIDMFYRNLSSEFLEHYLLLNSDVDFVLGMDDFVRQMAALNRSPVFYYLFTYEGTYSMLKKLVKVTRPGTAHGDELGYLFSQSKVRPLSWRVIPPDDARTIGYITKLWTDFAKAGVPTPTSALGVEWRAVEAPLNDPNLAITRYLDIGEQLVMKESNLNAERIAFWHKLRLQYQMPKLENHEKEERK